MNRRELDQDPGSIENRVGRVTGMHGDTLTIEQQEEGHDLLLIHGPRGAHKYQFTVSREQLVRLAHDILGREIR